MRRKRYFALPLAMTLVTTHKNKTTRRSRGIDRYLS